jgi:hypothetical protein
MFGGVYRPIVGGKHCPAAGMRTAPEAVLGRCHRESSPDPGQERRMERLSVHLIVVVVFRLRRG